MDLSSDLFVQFKQDLQFNIKYECAGLTLAFKVNVNGEDLWTAYMEGLPSHKRDLHNCSKCKDFVVKYGGLVYADYFDGSLVMRSIWDFKTNELYQASVSAMSGMVRSCPIKEVFVPYKQALGTDFTLQESRGNAYRHEHLFFQLDSKSFNTRVMELSSLKKRNRQRSRTKESKEALMRSLDSIDVDVAKRVIRVVKDDPKAISVSSALEMFIKHLEVYQLLSSVDKDVYCWITSRRNAKFLNTLGESSIGKFVVRVINERMTDDDIRFEAVRLMELR